MVILTPKEEIAQYEKYNHPFSPSNNDRSYQTYLKTIFSKKGELHHIKGKKIPEEVVNINRVRVGEENNEEYLVWDINQLGQDINERVWPCFIQDLGRYREFNWIRRPLPRANTGEPGDLEPDFKFEPEGFTYKYKYKFSNKEFLDTLLKNTNNTTTYHVYDTTFGGRGGPTERIRVKNREDWLNRPFDELIKALYLQENKLKERLKAIEEKERFLGLVERNNK
jgi:hypothetical protein